MLGKRSFSTATISAVSSTDSVVWVTKASFVGVARRKGARLGDGLDQADGALGELAHGPDHLRVAGMADQDDLQALLVVAGGLDVHLGHQRAGGVQDEQVAGLGGRRDGLGDAMCRKDHGLVGLWDILKLLHKNGTFGLQGFDDESVVHDLMAHVDGGAVLGERQLDDLDGPVDARAEAARRRQVNGEGRTLRACCRRG